MPSYWENKKNVREVLCPARYALQRGRNGAAGGRYSERGKWALFNFTGNTTGSFNLTIIKGLLGNKAASSSPFLKDVTLSGYKIRALETILCYP